MRRIAIMLCLGTLLALACQPSFALLFTASDAAGYAATAEFTTYMVGLTNYLQLDLANLTDNTKFAANLQQAVLGSFVWNYSGTAAFTKDAAVALPAGAENGIYHQVQTDATHWGWAPGSWNATDATDPKGSPWAKADIGDDWTYVENASGAGSRFVGAMGYGNVALGDNLAKFHRKAGVSGVWTENPIDGVDFALLSAKPTDTYGNKTDNWPGGGQNFVLAPARLTWTYTGTFRLDEITDGGFQFGTAPDVTIHGNPVPEPASCALLALAVGGVGAMLKRRRK
jgi:hypothetical protein